MSTSLIELPPELLLAVITRLSSARSICRAASTCLALRAIEAANRQRLWETVASAEKLDLPLAVAAGLSWKSLVALDVASKKRRPAVVSKQSINAEFDFFAVMSSCDHSEPPFVVPLEFDGEARGIQLETPVFWEGPPPGVHWTSAGVAVYARAKHRKTIAKLFSFEREDIYQYADEPISRNDLWFEEGCCHWTHDKHYSNWVMMNVCVQHAFGDKTKWHTITLDNFHIPELLPESGERTGDSDPFSLMKFARVLHSKEMVWTPCIL